MKPGTYNISHVRGDDFAISFRFKTASLITISNPDGYFDFTGWTVAAQVRKTKGSAAIASPLTATFGGDPTEGRVFVSLPDRDVFTKEADMFWDLQLTDSSDTRRTFLAGTYKVAGDVTRT